MKLSYIYKYQDLSRYFWHQNTISHFTPSQITLYYYLLNRCDTCHWENPFVLCTSQIINDTGLSNDTISSGKIILKKAGVINFNTQKGSKYTGFQFPHIPIKSKIYPEGLENIRKELPNQSLGLNQTSDEPPPNLPHDLPEKSESLETTTIYINKHIVIQTHKELCAYFGFNENDYLSNWNLAQKFVKSLYRQGIIEKFIAQFYAYREYKYFTNEKIHGFKSFIGTSIKGFEDGGWNAENWDKKLQEKKSACSHKDLPGVHSVKININELINKQKDND